MASVYCADGFLSWVCVFLIFLFNLTASSVSLVLLVFSKKLSIPPFMSTDLRVCVATLSFIVFFRVSLNKDTDCRFGKKRRLVLR